MKFERKHPKVGGRRRGRPNRATVAKAQALADALISAALTPASSHRMLKLEFE